MTLTADYTLQKGIPKLKYKSEENIQNAAQKYKNILKLIKEFKRLHSI